MMKIVKRLDLEKFCEECGLSKDVLFGFIEETWIYPYDPERFLFDEEDLARAKLIQQLREEFEVNDAGVAIILHLLDQLNLIKGRLSKDDL